MPIPPRGRADYLRLGDWNAGCAGCARKFKAGSLRLDWKGFYKCPSCWESRQPQDFVRGVPDNMGAPWVQMYSTQSVAPPATLVLDGTWILNSSQELDANRNL